MTEQGTLPFVLSGQQIKTIKISEIKVAHRQRTIDPVKNEKEFKDWVEHIHKLATSIKRAGLIHPITLEDGTNKLIAGYNRMQAFMKLGYDEIPFVYRSELTDIDREVLELEENLQRLGLSFADQAKAIAKIDELQRKIATDKGETWTTRKTAEAVGMSVGTVVQSKKVVEAAKQDPTVLNASGLVAALNMIKTRDQVAKRKADILARDAGKIRTYPAEIITGDARELIKQEPDESFDAVITNFPFGVDLAMGKERKEVYHDEEDHIVKLVRDVVHESYRVLKPDSWFVGFFDIRKITYSNKQREFVEGSLGIFNHMLKHQWMTEDLHYKMTLLAYESLGLSYWLEEAGFDYVQTLPNVWVKPNKTQGMIGDPNKGLIMTYEMFIFAAKGNALLFKKGRQNSFIYDTPVGLSRDIDVQMPVSICQELVAMTCLGGSRILDPFAGSGAVGEGALNSQCSFRGYELDPQRAEMGNLRLRENIHANDPTGKKDEDLAKTREFLANLQAMREEGLAQ